MWCDKLQSLCIVKLFTSKRQWPTNMFCLMKLVHKVWFLIKKAWYKYKHTRTIIQNTKYKVDQQSQDCSGPQICLATWRSSNKSSTGKFYSSHLCLSLWRKECVSCEKRKPSSLYQLPHQSYNCNTTSVMRSSSHAWRLHETLHWFKRAQLSTLPFRQ